MRKSLDTLGFFAREANDLALIRAAYGHAPADPPTQRAAHRLLPHAVVGHGRALQQEEHRGGRARPCAPPAPRCANGRCPRAGHALMHGAQPRHDQGGDAVTTPRSARASRTCFSPSLTAALEVGRRRDTAANSPTPRSASASRSAELAEVWETFDFLLAPSAQRRGAGRPRLHRRSDLQPLLDPARHALHRAAVQHRPVRPAAVGAAHRPARRRRPAHRLGALGRSSGSS